MLYIKIISGDTEAVDIHTSYTFKIVPCDDSTGLLGSITTDVVDSWLITKDCQVYVTNNLSENIYMKKKGHDICSRSKIAPEFDGII